jgi:hypothetical protein
MHQLMRRVALGLTLPLVVGAPALLLAVPAHAVGTPTDVTLTSPANPSVYGQEVRVTAHVTVAESEQVVTAGSIQFRADAVEIGDPVHLDAAGNATSLPIFDEGGVLDVTMISEFYQVTAEFIPDDPMVFAGDSASPIYQEVEPSGSTMAILPSATTLVADLSGAFPGGVQQGSARPSGTVHFFVGGQDLQAAVDTNTGRATLNHVLPAGPQTVTATYSGDGRYTGTSEQLVRNDPSLQARVLSMFPKSKSGWYHTPVDIWFICKPAGSELVEECPADLSLKQSGKDQSVTRTIRAADGGSATLTISGIDIDRDKPVIKVNGRSCTATDKLSGVKGKCHMKIAKDGSYRAIANDKAGNRAVKRGILD